MKKELWLVVALLAYLGARLVPAQAGLGLPALAVLGVTAAGTILWITEAVPLGVTALLVIAVTLAFDLSGIAMMGSAAFLLVYATVNAGHLRVLKTTGANPIVVWASLVTCLGMFAMLALHTYRQQPAAIAALVAIAAASFLAEASYRRLTGRTIRLGELTAKAREHGPGSVERVTQQDLF